MKSAIYGCLAVVLALGLTGMVLAAETIPWKAGDPPKAAAPAGGESGGTAGGTGTGGGTGAAPSPEARVEKAAAPVKKILAQIETAQKRLDEELAKPADKQNLPTIRTMKEAIATRYLSAAQMAKAQSAAFKGDEKQAFLDQYDKPNREKAVSLWLELANDSLTKKDLRSAESIARQVLGLDPKNAEADALLKKVIEDKATAAKGGSKNDKKDKKDHPK